MIREPMIRESLADSNQIQWQVLENVRNWAVIGQIFE